MTQRRIRSVTVEYEDGSSDSWTGSGSVQSIRTPREAQGAPVLRPDDVCYVQALLTFDTAPVEHVPG